MRLAVKERLEALSEAHRGRLTPQMILEEARDPASPLHDEFPWDDAKAAEQYRLSIARRIFQSWKIRVTVEDTNISIRVPAFVRDPECSPQAQGYVSVLILRTEDENAREAMEAEVKRLLRHVEKLRSLALVLGTMAQLDQVQQSLDEVLSSIQVA